MLGRKTYTREELNQSRTAVDRQLAAYRDLMGGVPESESAAARTAFETYFFNNLILVLDRYFVHRVRLVTGKDGNPLNEVEVLADSILHNDGVLLASSVINLVPEKSILGLQAGDRIALTAEEFERLASEYFSELERRFVE